MFFPVDLTFLENVNHVPALPVIERSMNRPDLQLTDFCIPANPYFPTQNMFEKMQKDLPGILRFYPSDNQSISRMLAGFLCLKEENLVVANGSTELITWINERLITKDLVTDVPTFGRWTDNPRELGRHVHFYLREHSRGFQLDVDECVALVNDRKAHALTICNPNNPTGAVLNRDEIFRLLEQTAHLELVVIDESFIDFVSETIPTMARDVVDFPNLIVIKSLGKNLGLHGLRCG